VSSDSLRPAWSEQFLLESIRQLPASGPLAEITPEWAWGGSDGRGVRVAVVDTGIEADHPIFAGRIAGGVIIELDDTAPDGYVAQPDDPPGDPAGHGTACAGIIHTLAPEAELFSVRVLGSNMRGRAINFAAGIEWAIEHGFNVINMSLSTSNQDHLALFHQLADMAYFRNVVLVSAVNNIPAPSYPSTFSSVISVAAHDCPDPFTFYYNPNPPVEFGAPGIDVKVAWAGKQYAVNTGNSFAAPHIAGIVTLIRAKHPELTPFQIKTVLMACAANVRKTR
jgi:subtilisin family serine protease